VTDFGKLLHHFRQRCNDPENAGRKLSQERLGELLGEEMNIRPGYSGAAVSDWERGKSKIHADQRRVLISLVKILNRLGGVKTPLDANELLEAGYYRALDAVERQQIFPKESVDVAFEVPTTNKSENHQRNLIFPGKKKFSELKDELQRLLDDAQEGPPPSWPRLAAALLRRFLNYWSVSNMIIVLFWFWVWLLTWRLIAPSLRLPFTSRENAAMALKVYIVGTIVTPLLIGVLTNPKQNKFWQEHNLASNYVTYLYTYQGAGIGFHLGYFGVFVINLLGYYMHLHFALWFELIETGTILLWGYFAAHLVPYNLWRAYGRLDLVDGWVFFIFLPVGIFWGIFFFEFYPLFFTSIIGGFSILVAVTLLILITAWRQYRSTLPN
jgi:hypothetical protein